jgi:general secretion pathway protein K
VLVTWVFMILGVLALDFARYMRDDATAAINLAEETRNYYVAVGGMNRVIYDIEQEEPGRRTGAITPERRTRLAARGDAPFAHCAGGACARRSKSHADEEDADADGGDDGDDDESDDAESDDEETSLGTSDGEWHEEVLDGVRYGVRVIDERGLIPLNDAAQEVGAPVLRLVIKNLLGYGGTAGTDRQGDAAVATVVDSIVDWYDRNDEVGLHGAESRYYLDREPSYPAKNGDFDSVEELLLVRGVTPELYYGHDGVPGLKDIFTPYVRTRGEHPKVMFMAAPAPVLQALLGIDAEEAEELITVREEEEVATFQQKLTEKFQAVDPALGPQIRGGSTNAKVVRIEARANVSEPRNQARIAAVVELSSELTEGVRIIRWFDRAPWQGGLPAGTGDGPA